VEDRGYHPGSGDRTRGLPVGIDVLFGLIAFGTIGFIWAILPEPYTDDPDR